MLRLDIVRNEGLRRHIDVHGLIEPARQMIQSEHPIDQRDLRPIVEMTPFVPDDRVDLITTGFVRFFNGDFFSALHILVPQLENTLRHILKITGVDPSTIKSDMTQESRTLSVLLTRERESLEGILGFNNRLRNRESIPFSRWPLCPTSNGARPNLFHRLLRCRLYLRVLVHLSLLLPAIVCALAARGPKARHAIVHPSLLPPTALMYLSFIVR